ncbi:hypothetical protein CYY_010030 [Polysphondylium violaceum]|uniref:Uncharacterized protein n=1 Tax=Polysphondylium violaceum TaxID=133409 RepID=A0A8J4PL99_9MYCE|nr:hypothetical protein CYY_010030 [Polysphondylium violaceum]
MLPEQEKEGQNAFRPIPEIDPLTKCYGTFIHLSNSMNIRLPERKNRILLQECVQDSMFCLPPTLKRGKNFDGKIENSNQTAGFQAYLEP